MSAIEVLAEVSIARPAGEVFAYIADMSRNTEWQKGMQECRWTSEPPLRLGSTYDQVAAFLGKEIVSSFEVTEFVDGERIRIESTGGSMPLDITRSVQATGEGSCSVSARVCGDAAGVFSIAAPLMKAMVGRSVRADYQRLKRQIEASV